MALREIHAEGLVLRLVPAGDDVDAGAAMGDRREQRRRIATIDEHAPVERRRAEVAVPLATLAVAGGAVLGEQPRAALGGGEAD